MANDKEYERHKKYEGYIRPKVTTNSFRMDEELYRLNEIIRVYNSNEFVSPSNIDIQRILFDRYVKELRERDPKKVMEIEEAINFFSKRTEKDK